MLLLRVTSIAKVINLNAFLPVSYTHLTLMNPWQAARKEVANASRHNELSIGGSASLWECMLNGWLGKRHAQPN